MSQQSLPFDQEPSGLHVIPVHHNLIETTCNIILEQHAAQLPDLSTITVLLPDNSAIDFCRQVLLQQALSRGCDALLGPHITPLSHWLNEQSIDRQVINNYAREMLLVGALTEHPHIYGHGNPWLLSDSLLELFDELTQWHVLLPESVNDFIAKLVKAYGATDAVQETLGREALLVHTLWCALHEQLNELGVVDHHSAMLLKLGNSASQLRNNEQLYYCGVSNPTPAETQWRKQLFHRQQLHIVTHDFVRLTATEDAPAYVQCLDRIFDYQDQELQQRAARCRKLFPVSPVTPVISVYAASDAEDEALAVDIQVRQWLLQGKTQIGIVTENRKLARRVRALLERAAVTVEDNAGWPLSTTSAATVLERWLQTIEEDFHYRPLLDCLKSPFVLDDGEGFVHQVYILEQHIIIDENTPNNLDRYLQHIKLRRDKLPAGMDTGNYDALTVLIDDIRHAAEPLLALLSLDASPAKTYLDALLESLRRLKVVDAYQHDEAGIQLLAEIDQLKSAANLTSMDFDWPTFRNWLGLALERFNFKIRHHASSVKLLTLDSSECYSFDALVLAGAEEEFLPRRANQSPFFNDSVRSMLNVPTQQQKRLLSYYYFRRLLLSVPYNNPGSPNILISRRARENDEDIIPSPWLAALQSFHQLAYGDDLTNRALAELIRNGDSHVQHDDAPLPRPAAPAPQPVTPATLVPATLSASAYQQLVDCPYQFFAARCLHLAPPDTIKEALQKSDYGEKIHQCLEAFHSNLPGLPGPFNETVTPQNRDEAEKLLNDIAIEVFSREVEDNFMHRGWLKRWQAVVPRYIDWQIQQQQHGLPHATEIRIRKAKLANNVTVNGRIDRIDTGDRRLSVIDYKTGAIPATDDVLNGEAVQLPFYLLLLMTDSVDDTIASLLEQDCNIQAMYVDVGDINKVQSRSAVQDHALRQLVHDNRERLLNVMELISDGQPLPAWGDNKTCAYCPMDGLCRKQTWAQ